MRGNAGVNGVGLPHTPGGAVNPPDLTKVGKKLEEGDGRADVAFQR
jgi:hypothetical protein